MYRMKNDLKNQVCAYNKDELIAEPNAEALERWPSAFEKLDENTPEEEVRAIIEDVEEAVETKTKSTSTKFGSKSRARKPKPRNA